MIRVIQQGKYKLIETARQTKIISFSTNSQTIGFAWITAENIGEILVPIKKDYLIDHVLAIGKYRLYEVKNEKNLVDLEHLELQVGKHLWQGYLLPTGLPNRAKSCKRIIPTKEIITKTTARNYLVPLQA
jgi:hypothetical protein